MIQRNRASANLNCVKKLGGRKYLLQQMSRPEIGCLQNNQNGYKTTSHYRVFNTRYRVQETGGQVWR
jgi:hypothetical protein